MSGQELDYDTFKMEFDKNPKLKSVIQSFNKYGLVIKTDEKEMPTEFGQKPKTSNADAVRAADKVLQQPG